jgi:hypothetical protein
MKKVLVAAIVLLCIACKKEIQNDAATKTPAIQGKCGIILSTPVLDSFVYPTYYISFNIAFPDGNEIMHLHDNVTGDHDGSWFIPKYDKGSSFCVTP